MTAVSARHVPLLLGLMLILLVPVARMRFEVQRVDDCVAPEALLELASVPGSKRGVERWEKYDDDLRQWTVVDLLGGGREFALRGALVRSFRPSDLYSRPPRFVLGGFEAEQREIAEVPVGDVVLPIHTIRDATRGRSALASWFFVYQGRPVRHPILAQLRAAPGQVWNGTSPLSLVIVGGPVAESQLDAARERAREWLVAAWRHHQRGCPPEPAG